MTKSTILLGAAPFAAGLVLAGCAAAPGDVASSSQAATSTHCPDYSCWSVQENWGEALDSEKDEAVNDAFASLAGKMGDYDANAAGAMAAVPGSTNFGDAIRQTQTALQGHVTELASQGLAVSDLVPSALMIVVGGKISGQLPTAAGGAGQVMLGFMLMPVKVTWKDAGDPNVYHAWRFKIGVSAFANASVGVGAGASAGWIVGAGAVWGTLPDLDSVSGGLVGVSASGTLGIGLLGDLWVLKRPTSVTDLTSLSLDDGKTNIIGYAAWSIGVADEAAVRIAVGTAFSSDEILQHMGIPTAPDPSTSQSGYQVQGPTHADGAGAPATTTPPAGG